MAEINSLAADYYAFKSYVNGIIANSKLPNELTKTQKELLMDNLYPRILNNGVKYRTDKGDNEDYGAFQIGDVIMHVDTSTDTKYFAEVLDPDLTLPADFTDTEKINLYSKDKPAIAL